MRNLTLVGLLLCLHCGSLIAQDIQEVVAVDTGLGFTRSFASPADPNPNLVIEELLNDGTAAAVFVQETGDYQTSMVQACDMALCRYNASYVTGASSDARAAYSVLTCEAKAKAASMDELNNEIGSSFLWVNPSPYIFNESNYKNLTFRSSHWTILWRID